MNQDCLIRAITEDGLIKAAAVSGAGFAEQARQIHHLTPVATAALGRTLSAASIMGEALKEDAASLTLRIRGGGPLGTVLAVSDHQGNVRGWVENPDVNLPLRPDGKLDVGGAVGSDGTLTVIRDLRMKEPYTGSVNLLSGEIAEDIAAYFSESEQVPTACALGVLVNRDQSVLAAGGYMIQLLPGAPENLIEKIEKSVYKSGPVTGILRDNPDPEYLLKTVLPDFNLKFFDRVPVEYRCDCSRRRMESALIALGKKDLKNLMDEQENIVLSCQFCGKSQTFTRENISQILANI